MEDEAAIYYTSPTSDCSCSLETGTCMSLRMFMASRHTILRLLYNTVMYVCMYVLHCHLVTLIYNAFPCAQRI
jgi:hypothetical protein